MSYGKLVVCVVCVILVGSLYWVMQDSSAGTGEVVEPGQDTHVVADPVAVPPQVAVPVAEVVVTDEVEPADENRQTENRTEVEQALAEIKGRCIDSDGQPLEGVSVRLRGSPERRRMPAYTRDHGEVEFENPEIVETDADGRFAVRFDPPPPYRFFLSLERSDLVRSSGRWSVIEAGASLELGEVTLQPGVSVTGRVVDEAGVPVRPPDRRTTISFRLEGDVMSRLTGIQPSWSSSARLATDGTFKLRGLLLPGKWTVNLREHDLITKAVTIDEQAAALEIVVKPSGEVLTLRGVVVDESGKPVARANISPRSRTGSGRSTTSKRDGTFVLKKRPDGDPEEEFTLTAHALDCEYLRTEELYNWGDEGVELVMRRGLGLKLRVVRAEDGAPVEAFTARVVPIGSGFSSSRDREPRRGTKHTGGVLDLEGIRRGRVAIFVEPAAATGLASAQRFVELEGDANAVIEMRLPASVLQVIRVRTSDGKPVAATKVELIDAMGDEIEATTYIREFDSGGSSSAELGLLLAERKTDANGEVRVRGALDKPHVIRCFGDHPAVVLQGVSLSEQPIEIVVPVGATVRVTAAPLSVLSYWREEAGLPATGELDKRHLRSAPRIYLSRQVEGKHESFPPSSVFRPGVPLDAEGRAELRGAPEGEWDLMLARSISFGSGSSGKSERIRQGLQLRDGKVEEIEWDLSPHEPGGVEGTVLVDDKPVIGSLRVWRELDEVMTNGQRQRDTKHVKVSPEGYVDARLPPGLWHGTFTMRVGTEQWLYIPLTPTFAVVSGQDTEVALRGYVAARKVRILDPEGKPAPGVSLYLSLKDTSGLQLEPTDASGEAVIKGAPGLYGVRLRVRSLSSDIALGQWRNKKLAESGNDWKAVRDATQAQYLTLPDIALEPGGEGETLVIQLPKEWDR